MIGPPTAKAAANSDMALQKSYPGNGVLPTCGIRQNGHEDRDYDGTW